jgi:hypothetical protein
MSKFRNWYVRNQDAITWFIIGFLTVNLIHNLADQEWIWSVVNAVLIWANYKLSGIRLT